MSAADGGYEARLSLDWDGVAAPGADAPRVFFDAVPAAVPAGFDDWISFLLETEEASPEFNTLGNDLHDLLIAGDIDTQLKRARSQGPFRLLLKVEGTDLDALPWELMRRSGMTLFTNASQPTSRVAPWYNPDFEPPQMCWPLRVMVVVGSADKKIKVDEEIKYIRDGFRKVCGLVDLEVARLPDRDKIRKLAQAIRPDVFHFIGHGAHDDETGGHLLLEQEGGASIEWTAAYIRDDLDGTVPRLAVLNACQSGEVEAHKGTRAAAQGLAELNVPAVIAMQGPIRGEAAARFAKGFYETLSAGQPLDQAVARRARRSPSWRRPAAATTRSRR